MIGVVVHVADLFSLRRKRAGGITAALLLLCGVHARAATTDYLIDGWDTENNLPSSTVTSIEQTRDGYLWVGTYNGLARFDGARFVTYDPVNHPALSQNRIQGLYLDANGTLWIATFRGGLTSYRDGEFRREWPDQTLFDQHTILVHSTTNLVTFVTQAGDVLQRNPLATNQDWNLVTQPENANAIYQCVDRAGTLWFLTRDRHILQFSNGAFRELPKDGGLPGGHINTVAADKRGQVWAGADNEIA